MSNQLTDDHLDELEERGYVIVHDFLAEEQRMEISAAVRRVLKPWDEIKNDPPESRTDSRVFPFEEPVLNNAAVNREAIQFSRKWFRTDDIHFRPRSCIARYPGFRWKSPNAHQDNGNNSLLPPSDSDRTHAQLWFWIHPEPVEEGQAALRLVANEHKGDISKAEALLCPGGTLCIFHTHTWHSASDYIREDGQRYTWGFAFGHGDHCWEGVKHYTDVGNNPNFQNFIGNLNARDRELFRFPPAGHPYYTAQTLEALEKQYPGWNAGDEYSPAVR
ncbi:MAG: hypothetical protein O3B01_06110 [Planctomycetota bacterium]|nr:hypothetical protein [Planctomycetota bacterium]MDA1138138.1 hypothetical protein [Planctomycetota bacterium]